MDAHVKDIELKRAFENAGLLFERGHGNAERSGHSNTERSAHGATERTARAAREERTAREKRPQGESAEKKPETAADREALEHYLGDVKDRLAKNNVELKFTFHDETGDLQVELVSGENEKVVRKIPPDELLKLSASLKEMAGAFLNRSV